MNIFKQFFLLFTNFRKLSTKFKRKTTTTTTKGNTFEIVAGGLQTKEVR